MDKFEEAAREFPFSKCIEEDGTVSLVRCVLGISGLADAFRWYEDKYLADALHAPVMIERERRAAEQENRMHESYVQASLDEKREKETCECDLARAIKKMEREK